MVGQSLNNPHLEVLTQALATYLEQPAFTRRQRHHLVMWIWRPQHSEGGITVVKDIKVLAIHIHAQRDA